jgi:hypothetical protein
MPIQVKITSETKEKGVFRAAGTVTAPAGTEKGKATVYVAKAEGAAPRLVLSEQGKTTILGNEVTEYKSYTYEGDQVSVELAKDVELTFKDLNFAI